MVAKEFKTESRPDLFVATPPLESLTMILSRAAITKGRKQKGILYPDVSRAYFYAKSLRPVYITIPAEYHEDGDEH